MKNDAETLRQISRSLGALELRRLRVIAKSEPDKRLATAKMEATAAFVAVLRASLERRARRAERP
jgi:hypothetical protein